MDPRVSSRQDLLTLSNEELFRIKLRLVRSVEDLEFLRRDLEEEGTELQKLNLELKDGLQKIDPESEVISEDNDEEYELTEPNQTLKEMLGQKSVKIFGAVKGALKTGLSTLASPHKEDRQTVNLRGIHDNTREARGQRLSEFGFQPRKSDAPLEKKTEDSNYELEKPPGFDFAIPVPKKRKKFTAKEDEDDWEDIKRMVLETHSHESDSVKSSNGSDTFVMLSEPLPSSGSGNSHKLLSPTINRQVSEEISHEDDDSNMPEAE